MYSVGFGLFIPIVHAMISSRVSDNGGFVSSALGSPFPSGEALGAIAVNLAGTVLLIPALTPIMVIQAAATAATSPAKPIDAGNGARVMSEQAVRRSCGRYRDHQ